MAAPWFDAPVHGPSASVGPFESSGVVFMPVIAPSEASTLPALPKKIRVGDSDLAGKLVRHRNDYKLAIDTLRILIANTVAELAATLGPLLPRPAEAKKTLDNLLAAPAVIHSTRSIIVVELAPAATRRERAAFIELLRPINARKLSLPGDPARRPLRFKVQLERDEPL